MQRHDASYEIPDRGVPAEPDANRANSGNAPISLDFKDGDLQDIFRLFSDSKSSFGRRPS